MIEKIENVSLEICSQIFQETRRIQDPVQFTGRKQKPQRQLTELGSNITNVYYSFLLKQFFPLKSSSVLQKIAKLR